MSMIAPPERKSVQLPAGGGETSRSSWRNNLHSAFRGFKRGFRGQSSFFAHFFYGVLALTAGIVLRCDIFDWTLLIVGFALISITELFNSAMQSLVQGLPEPARTRVRPCLEIAAAAGLIANAAAITIGCLVFLQRLLAVFG